MLNQNKFKIIVRQDIGELSPKELELIWLIRHVYRFGRLEILVHSGSPEDLIKTVERNRLGNGVDLSTVEDIE